MSTEFMECQPTPKLQTACAVEHVGQEDRVILTGEITNVEMNKSSFGEKEVTMGITIQTEKMGYVVLRGPIDIYKAFKIGDRVSVDIR
jgi:hypothetical protein